MASRRPPVPALFGVLLVSLALAVPAGGATRTYTTGPLRAAIPDGSWIEHPITVRDAGPVAHLAVFLRLDHPRISDLTITLRSPSGHPVVLTARSGNGRGFGSGPGCSGQLTMFEDGGTPLDDASAPYTEDVFRPEDRLATLKGDEAKGKWTLRVADAAGGGRGGVLRCWRLEVARDILERHTARSGAVAATLSYREAVDVYRDVRLRIVRSGETALDVAVPGAGLPGWRPVAPPVVRRLDADAEPEVLLDVFTGGAHCCTVSHLYRWSARSGRYLRSTRDWGNVGYRIADLNRDGRVELASADDRFNAQFTAYAASVAPIRIFRLDRGRFLEVTRRYPAAVKRDASSAWSSYRRYRARGEEVRGVLAAWIADQYLLGKGERAWKQLAIAFRRGELGRTAVKDGYPAGREYLTGLRKFLIRHGYARAK
jgi:subtilisin-like proprotein convertase family protein